MKFTYNWIKEFVLVSLKPAALADKLTMAGLEVKGVEDRQGDVVFDVEITSNRPDWLSIVGIAREISALTGRKLIVPKAQGVQASQSPGHKCLAVRIADKRDCPLYTARVIHKVAVAPSPAWLKERLELIGCRSINNVVDITNYILYTYGEPLHAFDMDTLRDGRIEVRRARDKEKIVTIDGIERALGPETLIIADGQRPVALAGIMGGKETEVGDRTTAVVLEAAVFHPGLIRKGGRRCGISTESSYRFERGVDPAMAVFASRKAAHMIKEIAGGVESAAAGTRWVTPKARRVAVTVSGIHQMLGVKVGRPAIKKILSHLGFSAASAGSDILRVVVPSWRQDVTAPVDVIEEVARIYGYDKIPVVLAPVKPAVSARTVRDDIAQVKSILTGLGYDEVITYSLVDAETARYGAQLFARVPAELLNPLNSGQGVLRTSLIPSLVHCAGTNFNHKQESVALFEIAKVFSRGRTIDEHYALGAVVSGERSILLERGAVKEKAGFYHLKGIVETLCERLGVPECVFVPSGTAGVTSVLLGDENIGAIVRADEKLAALCDIKGADVCALEIDLKKILVKVHAGPGRKYHPVPRYPGISRDISFIKPEALPFADIGAAMTAAGQPYLRDIRVIDYYQGKQIPAGSRSMTVSCLYRSDERTLTDAQIEPVHASLCCLLKEKFGLILR